MLISPAAKEDIIGCGPKEKEELIELRFLEVAVDGRRGAAWMAKLPSGGGVDAISMCKSMTMTLTKLQLGEPAASPGT